MRLLAGLGILGLASTVMWGQPQPPQPPRQPAQARRAVTVADGQTSYLGIGTVDVSADRAKALNMKEERGAEVTAVSEDSPAAKAGVKAGDVILEYNGEKVEGAAQLQRLVRETPVGRQVKFSVWRDGKTQSLTATTSARRGVTVFSNNGTAIALPDIDVRVPELNLRLRDFERNMPDIPRFEMIFSSRMLGITGEALGQQPQLAEFFGVKEGVLVKSVLPNSAAEKGGIKAGDVIVKIDDNKVGTTDDILKTLRTPNKSNFSVVVVRNKKEMPIAVTIESRTGGGGMRAWMTAVNC